MNENETVSEIIEPVTRQGVSAKNGKPWSMAKIVTNSGKSASCFNPVIVGDVVEMTYNDQYKNWNAKVVSNKQRTYTQPQQGGDDISKVLNMIYEQNELIIKGINSLLGTDDSLQLIEKPKTLSGYEKAKAQAENLAGYKKDDGEPLPEPPADLGLYQEGLPY